MYFIAPSVPTFEVVGGILTLCIYVCPYVTIVIHSAYTYIVPTCFSNGRQCINNVIEIKKNSFLLLVGVSGLLEDF